MARLQTKHVESPGLTHSGAILGTPPYMAPVEARGRTREIGPRTAVYALGAILHRLLTGRPPFQAATVMDTLTQVLEVEPAAPSELQAAGTLAWHSRAVTKHFDEALVGNAIVSLKVPSGCAADAERSLLPGGVTFGACWVAQLLTVLCLPHVEHL